MDRRCSLVIILSECSVVELWPDFSTVVDLFSSHGVVVAAHGPELVSLLWLPPFTALIEFMPYKVHSLKYSSLAAMVGVARYPIHPRPDSVHDQVLCPRRACHTPHGTLFIGVSFCFEGRAGVEGRWLFTRARKGVGSPFVALCAGCRQVTRCTSPFRL